VPSLAGSASYYADSFAARNAAQRARVASAILFLPAAEILPFAGAERGFATNNTDCEFFRRLAHLALCVAAIFLREDADMVRLAGVAPVAFATAAAGCDCLRTLAHRAFCASAILRREAAEIIRIGWLGCCKVTVPFKDSIPEMIWFNFSKRNCVALRSLRSS
jgi:hypothetical protein